MHWCQWCQVLMQILCTRLSGCDSDHNDLCVQCPLIDWYFLVGLNPLPVIPLIFKLDNFSNCPILNERLWLIMVGQYILCVIEHLLWGRQGSDRVNTVTGLKLVCWETQQDSKWFPWVYPLPLSPSLLLFLSTVLWTRQEPSDMALPPHPRSGTLWCVNVFILSLKRI